MNTSKNKSQGNYAVIEFDCNRDEIVTFYYNSYKDADMHRILDKNATGCQILKKDRDGHWFPLDEYYI